MPCKEEHAVQVVQVLLLLVQHHAQLDRVQQPGIQVLLHDISVLPHHQQHLVQLLLLQVVVQQRRVVVRVAHRLQRQVGDHAALLLRDELPLGRRQVGREQAHAVQVGERHERLRVALLDQHAANVARATSDRPSEPTQLRLRWNLRVEKALQVLHEHELIAGGGQLGAQGQEHLLEHLALRDHDVSVQLACGAVLRRLLQVRVQLLIGCCPSRQRGEVLHMTRPFQHYVVQHLEQGAQLVLRQQRRHLLADDLQNESARVARDGRVLDGPHLVQTHRHQRAPAQEEAHVVHHTGGALQQQYTHGGQQSAPRVDHHVVEQPRDLAGVQLLFHRPVLHHLQNGLLAVVAVRIVLHHAALEADLQRPLLLAEQLQDGGEGVAHHEVVVHVGDVGPHLHLRAHHRGNGVRHALDVRRVVQAAVHAAVELRHEEPARQPPPLRVLLEGALQLQSDVGTGDLHLVGVVRHLLFFLTSERWVF